MGKPTPTGRDSSAPDKPANRSAKSRQASSRAAKAPTTTEGAKAGAKTAGPPKRTENQSFALRPGRTTSRNDAARHGAGEPMRIAKAMARAGLCSRREAERWIALGRVSVNGTVLRTPAVEVSARDKVLVDGQPLPLAEPARLWRYHKPRGLVTTHADPEGRPTVFDSLPPDLPRVISIGRLDFNTEGLLLLTNDGALARHLELPSTGWLRRYRVRAHGRVEQAALDKLKDGIEVDGVRYGPVEATLDSLQGANIWLTLALREGKNREVRRILEHLGLSVNRLIRVSYGPFQLLDLAPGEVDSVKRRVIADQLGPELAERLGLTGPEPDVQVTNRWRAESAALRTAPRREARNDEPGQRPRADEPAPRPARPNPQGKVPQSAAKRHALAEQRNDRQRRAGRPSTGDRERQREQEQEQEKGRGRGRKRGGPGKGPRKGPGAKR